MNNISKEHIKKLKFLPYRVLFSARRVYNCFSSNSRLSPRLTEECFRELENQSRGHGWLFKKIQRSMYFYKALLSSLDAKPNTILGVLTCLLIVKK